MVSQSRTWVIAGAFLALTSGFVAAVNADNSKHYRSSEMVLTAAVESGKACNSAKDAAAMQSDIDLDKQAVVANAQQPVDAQLAEYLELHERTESRTLRATMMPWSAL